MNILPFYPQHPVLKPHIEFYYFLKADQPDFETNYYAFPNTTIPLSIHRSATFEIKEKFTRVEAIENGLPAALLQRNLQQPLRVRLHGPIDKVTICFKPFGISSFITRSFSEVAPADSQEFIEWNNLPAYRRFHEVFFTAENDQQRVSLLEDLLLSLYNFPGDEKVMSRAITLLSDFDERYSMDEIAKELSLSTRSFNRLFQKNMSISPVTWKKIARFRHSMNNKLFANRFKSLTDIGYESDFYDQSYFIKFYQKLTGSNPTAFFKSIDKLADDQLIFRFVKG